MKAVVIGLTFFLAAPMFSFPTRCVGTGSLKAVRWDGVERWYTKEATSDGSAGIMNEASVSSALMAATTRQQMRILLVAALVADRSFLQEPNGEACSSSAT